MLKRKLNGLRTKLARKIVALAARFARRSDLGRATVLWRMAEYVNRRSKPIRPLVDRLLLGNETELATDILVAVANSPLSERGYAKRKLYRVALWYGRVGLIEHGCVLLTRIADPRSRHGALLAFWHKFAFFDEESLRKADRYLDDGVEVAAAQKGLRLLWLGSNDEERVIELYERYLSSLQDLEGAAYQLALDGISVFSKANRPDLVAAVLKGDPRLHAVASESLCFYGFASEQVQLDTARHESSAQLYQSLLEGQARLEKQLSDRSLSIAIVGNSPCETGLGRGHEIDAHDLVIRFNKFSTNEKHAHDYGRKTSNVSVTKSILPKVHDSYQEGVGLIVVGEEPLAFPPELQAITDALPRFGGIGFAPIHVYRQLAQRLNAAPSSGIQLLYWIHLLRDGLENVDLYGFSMVDQVGPDARSSSYTKMTKPSFRHNWRGEAQLLEKIRAGSGGGFPDMFFVREQQSLVGKADFRPSRFKIIGNHSKYHCGSHAVIKYLRKHLKDQGVLVKDDSYDLLVVNGEGSMHHDSRDHRKKMTAMRDAVDSGRRAILINSVWQENSHADDEVLHRLDLVVARETLSREALKQHGVDAWVAPDLSYWAPVDGGVARDFANQPVVTDFYSHEFGTFVKINGGRESKLQYVDMKAMKWPDLVASLKTASVLITGRHHAVYAACRAEIPFIAFSGNTHKIEGLIASSGVPIPLCRDRRDLPEMLEWVGQNRHLYEELFAWMRRQPKFTVPFEML